MNPIHGTTCNCDKCRGFMSQRRAAHSALDGRVNNANLKVQ